MSKFWLYFAIGFVGNIVFQSFGLSWLASTLCSIAVALAISTLETLQVGKSGGNMPELEVDGRKQKSASPSSWWRLVLAWVTGA